MTKILYTKVQRLSLMAAFLLLTGCGLKPAEMLPGLQKQANDFAQKLYSGQGTPNGMKEALLPDLIDQIGGEKAIGSYLRSIYQGIAQMKREGFRNEFILLGNPTTPVKLDGKWVSLVPVSLGFRYSDGGNIAKMRLFGPTAAQVELHLLAVSADGGKHWRFAQADDQVESMQAMIAALREKVVVPVQLSGFKTS